MRGVTIIPPRPGYNYQNFIRQPVKCKGKIHLSWIGPINNIQPLRIKHTASRLTLVGSREWGAKARAVAKAGAARARLLASHGGRGPRRG